MAGAALTTVYLCILTLPLLYLRYYPFRDKLRVPKSVLLLGILAILSFECYGASRVIADGHFFFVHSVDGIRLLFYFLYFGYSCLTINERFAKHTFNALLLMIFMGLLTLPCSVIEFFYSDVEHILFYRSLVLIGEMSLFFYLWLKFTRSIVIPILEHSDNESMKLCSTVLFLLLTAIYLPTWNITWLSETPLSYIAIRVTGVMEAVITTLLYWKLLEQYEQNAEIMVREMETEKFIAISREHFHSVEEKINETRRLKHDFKHELILISDLAKQNKTEDIVNLIEEETALISKYALSHFSNNYELNVILSHYSERAKKSAIDCSILCDMPETLNMQPEDLWTMIGNLCLNAIEACERICDGPRKIDIVMKAQGNLIIIICQNTFNPDSLTPDKDLFQSSKTSGNCGNGLKSIRITAEKYNGKATFIPKGDLFVSNIYLYV